MGRPGCEQSLCGWGKHIYNKIAEIFAKRDLVILVHA